jgi:hypothetical protein
VAEQNQDRMKDDPREADEEGDPLATGRSRGHIVDREEPQGPTRTDPDKPGEQKDSAQHWESGRQRAN